MLRGRFVAVTGEAGVGKGAVLAAAARVWESQDRRVIPIAVAGATAQRLGEDLGAGATAMTLDGLVARLRHGRFELRDNDVIAIDEAGVIDTRRWAALLSAVGARATVVAVGDAAQLSPLSAGGLWPLLAEGGPQLSSVTGRSSEWERTAWQHLRAGRTREALAGYADHGQAHDMRDAGRGGAGGRQRVGPGWASRGDHHRCEQRRTRCCESPGPRAQSASRGAWR